MKAKKVIALLLVSAMSLSILACNGSTTPEDDSNAPVDSEVSSDATNGADSNSDYIEGFGNGLVDGAIVIEDRFDEDSVSPWGTYSKGASFDLYGENGELVVDIKSAGSLEYSTQIFRDGFTMNKGCVYEMTFDVRSDVERTFEWRIQINGEDYRAYYMEKGVTIGPETKTITAEFTMDEASDPAPRFCFNLGSQEGIDDSTPHRVYLDNIVLTIKDASNAMALEPLPVPISIKVNQLGYIPGETKKFVSKYVPGITDYSILDASTKEVVYTGKISEDYVNSTDCACSFGDFTDFNTAGKYIISVDGIGESYEFEIKENPYDEVYVDAVKMLYLQRCGMELTSDLAGEYAHKECHNTMATIYGTNETIDVSGGWHDAGDYGRYVSPAAKTIADLFYTYEEGNNIDTDAMGIPESGNGIPDILDEAKYELDWMLKMQADNGGVYHKVTCEVFPETVGPCEETDPLIVCPISFTATGDFAAVMAKASRIYADIDPEYAATCLEASKKAYKYMVDKDALSDTLGFKNPGAVVTGEYPDAKCVDEFFWAATELYLSTGDSSYLDKAKELFKTGILTGLGWADMGAYGIYAYLSAPEDKQIDAAYTEDLKKRLSTAMANEIKKIDKDAYGLSLGANYPWGSNMNVADNGILYLMAAKVLDKPEYAELARNQLNYLFGVNPLGYCYVTGYGSLTPDHVHHRPSQVAEATAKGMLVGGPNSNADDPYAKAVLHSRLGGMRYVDNSSSYSTNEVTIYWNSALIGLLSQLK